MNLTVPSFSPALVFAAAAAGLSGADLPSLADGSRGLIGERVDLVSLVPLVALTPLVMVFFLAQFVCRGYLFADASWLSVMRMAMKVSMGWPWPTVVWDR